MPRAMRAVACGKNVHRPQKSLVNPSGRAWHAACSAHHRNPQEVPRVAHPSERIVVIADMIERYVSEHPRAADTARGISHWWVEGHSGSPADVQQALDHLVEAGRLSRIMLADGTVIYARAGPPQRISDD